MMSINNMMSTITIDDKLQEAKNALRKAREALRTAQEQNPEGKALGWTAATEEAEGDAIDNLLAAIDNLRVYMPAYNPWHNKKLFASDP